MPLHYTNPNDWGKSPLSDNALRLQQLQAANSSTAVVHFISTVNPLADDEVED
jgi:hypothetical protein